MYDLAILFLHHNLSPITRFHFYQIHQHNPHIPLIPVSWDSLPYSSFNRFVKTKKAISAPYLTKMQQQIRKARIDPSRWKTIDDMLDWFHNDKRLYCWFDTYADQIPAERYIMLDWDTLVTTDLCSLYHHVWDADLAASWFNTPQTDPNWPWWNGQLTHSAGPMSGMLLSYGFLQWINASALEYEAFSELRLGTYAHEYGAVTKTLDLPYLMARNKGFPQVFGEGIYHPVKQYSDRAGFDGNLPATLEPIGL